VISQGSLTAVQNDAIGWLEWANPVQAEHFLLQIDLWRRGEAGADFSRALPENKKAPQRKGSFSLLQVYE
jgi:hypothetical protein